MEDTSISNKIKCEFLGDLIPYRCPKCGGCKKFSNLKDLKKHLESEHSFKLGCFTPSKSKLTSSQKMEKSLTEALRGKKLDGVKFEEDAASKANKESAVQLLKSYNEDMTYLENKVKQAKELETKNKLNRNSSIKFPKNGYSEESNKISSAPVMERQNNYCSANTLLHPKQLLLNSCQIAGNDQHAAIDDLVNDLKRKEVQLQSANRKLENLQRERDNLLLDMQKICQQADEGNHCLRNELRRKESLLDSVTEKLESVRSSMNRADNSSQSLSTYQLSVHNPYLKTHYENQRHELLRETTHLLHQAELDRSLLKQSLERREQDLERVNREMLRMRRDQEDMVQESMLLCDRANLGAEKLKGLVFTKDNQLQEAIAELERMKETQQSLIRQSTSLTQQGDSKNSVLIELLNEKAHELNCAKEELYHLKKQNDQALQNVVHEKQVELERAKTELKQVKERMQVLEERAKHLELKSFAENDKIQEMEHLVGEKVSKLSRTEEELSSLKSFISETAHKEIAARSKLETFISGLIERADRAESELSDLKGHSYSELDRDRSQASSALLSGVYSTSPEGKILCKKQQDESFKKEDIHRMHHTLTSAPAVQDLQRNATETAGLSGAQTYRNLEEERQTQSNEEKSLTSSGNSVWKDLLQENSLRYSHNSSEEQHMKRNKGKTKVSAIPNNTNNDNNIQDNVPKMTAIHQSISKSNDNLETVRAISKTNSRLLAKQENRKLKTKKKDKKGMPESLKYSKKETVITKSYNEFESFRSDLLEKLQDKAKKKISPEINNSNENPEKANESNESSIFGKNTYDKFNTSSCEKDENIYDKCKKGQDSSIRIENDKDAFAEDTDKSEKCSDGSEQVSKDVSYCDHRGQKSADHTKNLLNNNVMELKINDEHRNEQSTDVLRYSGIDSDGVQEAAMLHKEELLASNLVQKNICTSEPYPSSDEDNAESEAMNYAYQALNEDSDNSLGDQYQEQESFSVKIEEEIDPYVLHSTVQQRSKGPSPVKISGKTDNVGSKKTNRKPQTHFSSVKKLCCGSKEDLSDSIDFRVVGPGLLTAMDPFVGVTMKSAPSNILVEGPDDIIDTTLRSEPCNANSADQAFDQGSDSALKLSHDGFDSEIVHQPVVKNVEYDRKSSVDKATHQNLSLAKCTYFNQSKNLMSKDYEENVGHESLDDRSDKENTYESLSSHLSNKESMHGIVDSSKHEALSEHGESHEKFAESRSKTVNIDSLEESSLSTEKPQKSEEQDKADWTFSDIQDISSSKRIPIKPPRKRKPQNKIQLQHDMDISTTERYSLPKTLPKPDVPCPPFGHVATPKNSALESDNKKSAGTTNGLENAEETKRALPLPADNVDRDVKTGGNIDDDANEDQENKNENNFDNLLPRSSTKQLIIQTRTGSQISLEMEGPCEIDEQDIVYVPLDDKPSAGLHGFIASPKTIAKSNLGKESNKENMEDIFFQVDKEINKIPLKETQKQPQKLETKELKMEAVVSCQNKDTEDEEQVVAMAEGIVARKQEIKNQNDLIQRYLHEIGDDLDAEESYSDLEDASVQWSGEENFENADSLSDIQSLTDDSDFEWQDSCHEGNERFPMKDPDDVEDQNFENILDENGIIWDMENCHLTLLPSEVPNYLNLTASFLAKSQESEESRPDSHRISPYGSETGGNITICSQQKSILSTSNGSNSSSKDKKKNRVRFQLEQDLLENDLAYLTYGPSKDDLEFPFCTEEFAQGRESPDTKSDSVLYYRKFRHPSLSSSDSSSTMTLVQPSVLKMNSFEPDIMDKIKERKNLPFQNLNTGVSSYLQSHISTVQRNVSRDGKSFKESSTQTNEDQLLELILLNAKSPKDSALMTCDELSPLPKITTKGSFGLDDPILYTNRTLTQSLASPCSSSCEKSSQTNIERDTPYCKNTMTQTSLDKATCNVQKETDKNFKLESCFLEKVNRSTVTTQTSVQFSSNLKNYGDDTGKEAIMEKNDVFAERTGGNLTIDTQTSFDYDAVNAPNFSEDSFKENKTLSTNATDNHNRCKDLSMQVECDDMQSKSCLNVQIRDTKRTVSETEKFFSHDDSVKEKAISTDSGKKIIDRDTDGTRKSKNITDPLKYFNASQRRGKLEKGITFNHGSESENVSKTSYSISENDSIHTDVIEDDLRKRSREKLEEDNHLEEINDQCEKDVHVTNFEQVLEDDIIMNADDVFKEEGVIKEANEKENSLFTQGDDYVKHGPDYYFQPKDSVSSADDIEDDDTSNCSLFPSTASTLAGTSIKKNKKDLRDQRKALFHIFQFLDTITLGKTALVCKEWKRLSRQSSLWKRVILENRILTSKHLESISQYCSKTEVLVLKDIKVREKSALETEDEYISSIRGSLEPGLECMLQVSESYLRAVSIINCSHILTDKCIWMVGGYSRLLQRIFYQSNSDMPGPDALWAIGAGCGFLTHISIVPIQPCLIQHKFTSKCLQVISQCFPDLEVLEISGEEIDINGLCLIAKMCQRLQELSLYYATEITEDTVVALLRIGFHHLQILSFIHTVVTAPALVRIFESCKHLGRINVAIAIDDVQRESSDQLSETRRTKENSQEYNTLIAELEELKNRPGLGQILHLHFTRVTANKSRDDDSDDSM